MHSPEAISSVRFSGTGKSLWNRELSDRASSSDGSDQRRPLAPEFHFPNVDSRKPSMCAPLLPEPILLVLQRASDYDIYLDSNCGGSAWPPDDIDFNGESVLQGTKVGVHAESQSVQCERARADHHL
jgi:hypothetical protein|uniref:Uncharacterized protein n=1 Tax=Fagus sylvatica TaxID=28930 RepID=A0A2N9EQH1_FAGSY